MLPPFRFLAIAGTPAAVRRRITDARTLEGAILGLMLRDPGHDPHAVAMLAEAAAREPDAAGAILIANGVVLPGIPGVHWPASFLESVPLVRPTGGIVGASTHSLDEALRAEAAGADYVTFGPVFPTASKPGHPGTGLDRLAEVCRAISIPVFALGGIRMDTIDVSLDAGAYGIASISLFDEPAWMERALIHLHDR